MKKNMLTGLLVFLMASTGFFLSGCGARALKLESNIREQIYLSEAHFADVVYTETGQVDFNTNTSSSYVGDDKIFAKFATEVEDVINKIKIGETTYTQGVDVEILVNSSSKIVRNAFKVQNKALYISSLVVFLNLNNSGKLTVTFPENNISNIMVDLYESNNSLQVNLKPRKAETLFEVNKGDLIYNFKSDSPNNDFFVVINNRAENISTSLPILVLTVANPSKPNQSTAYKFENAIKPTEEDQNGILLFPGHNGGEPYTTTTPGDHKLVYTIYVPEIGVKRITVNFENTFTAA